MLKKINTSKKKNNSQLNTQYTIQNSMHSSAWGIIQPILGILLKVLRNLKNSPDILH